MKTDSIVLLANRGEIHDYVMSLWSDGPIKRNHADGGEIHALVDKFARTPKIFFQASDPLNEWSHFSPWWGAIQIAEYDNPTIRDLRYLHEMFHAATMPYSRGMNLRTMSQRNTQNEIEASTYSEIAIYLELPELRAMSFPHPIFADRLISPDGSGIPDRRLLERWRTQRDAVFKELMYARLQVVLADEDQIDPDDPQIVWLRRYPEQGHIWEGVWSHRHAMVDDAMVTLRERCETMGRRAAADMHLEWLLSPEIAGNTGIPFHREAVEFRRTFDALIAAYDQAMIQAEETSVRSRAA